MTLPPFTSTAPTAGLGAVRPWAREASLIAKRMKCASDLELGLDFMNLLSFSAAVTDA
jgi:hypothetical protein